METIYEYIKKNYRLACGSTGCGLVIHNSCGAGTYYVRNYCGMSSGPQC
jgi:hypothetical protein